MTEDRGRGGGWPVVGFYFFDVFQEEEHLAGRGFKAGDQLHDVGGGVSLAA